MYDLYHNGGVVEFDEGPIHPIYQEPQVEEPQVDQEPEVDQKPQLQDKHGEGDGGKWKFLFFASLVVIVWLFFK